MTTTAFSVPSPWNEPVQSYEKGSVVEEKLSSELKARRDKVQEIPIVIDGEHIYAGEVEDIVLPHDHKKVAARSHKVTSALMQRAIESSSKPQSVWSQLPQRERCAVFLRAARRMSTIDRYKVLASTMLFQNKTVEQAELDAACEAIDFLRYQAYFAQKVCALAPETSAKGEWNSMEARPLEGFVLALAPFNFTAISMNLAVAPALMGCSVIWKPSLEALPASYECLKIFEESGLPPGVINMVSGDPQMIGNFAFKSSKLSGVHFTGSTATFRHIWKSVGERISSYDSYPRLVGETGGKGFVFVHPSADTQAVISSLVRGAFEYQGQKCSAASRAYIPQSLWKVIKEPLLSLTSSLKMGAPDDRDTFVAALINHKAWNKVKGYLDLAHTQDEYEVLCGGKGDDSEGYFIQPTVVQSLHPNSQLMSEEIFGPVLTVYVYADDTLWDVVRQCEKTSPYGLSGAIFARDRVAVYNLSRILRNSAGNLYINVKPTGAVVGQQPFGGSRASGTNDKAGSHLLLQRWVNYRTIKEVFCLEDKFLFPDS
ncbi:MAG: L-glutamate gamma-semialdehyde dehydrogenase [Proteobacteria bacterium]|nr:L-glutamate gamma-semialdehyde dehydrogenase [Pseudomonadota bacterium]